MEWTAEIEKTLNSLIEDYGQEYWDADQGIGEYDPDGRKARIIHFVKNITKGESAIPAIRYEVISTETPEDSRGRHVLYTVVRFVGDAPREDVKTFNQEDRAKELVRDLTYQASKST